MELFIQIRDGQPYAHPIFGDNFRQAFPHIDVDNLPPEFARFVRLPSPALSGVSGVYKVVEGSYAWANGVVSDSWVIRDMTAEEKAAKIAEAMSMKPEGDQWVFNEDHCMWLDSTITDVVIEIGISRV